MRKLFSFLSAAEKDFCRAKNFDEVRILSFSKLRKLLHIFVEKIGDARIQVKTIFKF